DRLGCLRSALEPEGEPGQAGDLTAVDANEVRMLLGMLHVPDALLQLEAPYVIAQVRARQDVGLGEIHHDAMDGGAVEAAIAERLEELRVAVLAPVLVKILEYRDARRRASKASRTKESLQVLDVRARRFAWLGLHGDVTSTISQSRCKCSCDAIGAPP